MPRFYGHLMIGGVHTDVIDAETLLSGLLRRDDDGAVVFQRFIGRDRRFDDPPFL